MYLNCAFIILLGIFINVVNANNVTNDPTCQYGLKDCHICCHHTCESCNSCNNVTNQNCCGTTIRKTGRTCDLNVAPCFINSTESCGTIINGDNDNSDSEFGIDDMLEIAKYVGYGAAILCGIIFLIYVCCFFGDKKPPVEYMDIVGKFD